MWHYSWYGTPASQRTPEPSFIREEVSNDILGIGAASSNSKVPTQSRRWGGFQGKPLTTSTSVRLKVLLSRKGTISCGSSEDTPVRTVVWAHITPDRVMSYDLLPGRDSWDHFPVRIHRDTNEDETLVTFTAQDDGSAAGDHRFKKWVDQATGMIESPADCKVVVMKTSPTCSAKYLHGSRSSSEIAMGQPQTPDRIMYDSKTDGLRTRQ